MPTKYSSKQLKKKSSPINKWLVFGGVVLLVAVVLAITELTNTTHLFHTSVPTTASNSTTGSTPNTSTKTTASNSSTGAKSTSPTNATNVSLQSPYQSTYVSNHSPATVSDKLQSVCVTSPGASCTIEFTMNGVTKSLPATKADSSGSAYWSWSPKQLGLTSGQWTASAKVTLSGQSKVSTDTIPLEVP